jgi:hypothetical protein
MEVSRYVEKLKTDMINIDDKKKLLEEITKQLAPKEMEKKEFGEVFTPLHIVEEMLDTLPKEVWTNPILTFLEPGSGLGNFSICVFYRLMDGLKTEIPDSVERERHIIEKMLYMAECNKANVHICKSIFKAKKSGYKINLYQGDFLKLNPSEDRKKDEGETWPENWPKQFDIIVGNPPYQDNSGNKGSGHKLWNLFIKKSIKILIQDGYLLFINPSGWREPHGTFRDIFELLTSREIIFLSMNDYKKGSSVFNVGTNFDYYLLKNTLNVSNLTKIVDIKNNEFTFNLHNLSFIPSGKFDIFKDIIANDKEETVNVLYSRSEYGADKKHMSKIKNSEFKYPCVYTITTNNGVKLFYSNKKEGHFGIPKVIWSNGSGTYPVLDETGMYGLTQFSYAIIDKQENLQYIADALNTPEFIDLMTYVKFTDNKYNHKVIGLFKKDFYKYFLKSQSYANVVKTPAKKLVKVGKLKQSAGHSQSTSIKPQKTDKLNFILQNVYKIDINYKMFEKKLIELSVNIDYIPKLWNKYYINKKN